jgi:hypothetical protein
MAAWLGVGAPIDGESCRIRTVARAVSTVALADKPFWKNSINPPKLFIDMIFNTVNLD